MSVNDGVAVPRNSSNWTAPMIKRNYGDDTITRVK
jgi:hypothetical protein